MHDLGALASYFIAFMLAWQVVDVFRKRGRRLRETIALQRGLRWRHASYALMTLAITAAAFILFSSLGPWMHVGWWSLLGGEGSLVFADSSATRADSAGALLKLIPYTVPFLLLLTIPVVARAEERGFRRGGQRRTRPFRSIRHVVFGLMHMALGVPLAAGLALAVTGAIYARIYQRTWRRTASQGLATLEATRAHIATNTLIVTLVIVTLVLPRP